MPDIIDTIQEDQALQNTELLMRAHEAVQEIPAGRAGECDYCGEHSLRLVNEVCARCRDEFNLE